VKHIALVGIEPTTFRS